MFTYKICIQGKKLDCTNRQEIVLGNKNEYNVTCLEFDVDGKVPEGHRYIILQKQNGGKPVLVPLIDNIYTVGTSTTAHPGFWKFSLVVSSSANLKDDNIDKQSILFISDPESAEVKDSMLSPDIKPEEQEPNLKIYYETLDDLIKQTREVTAAAEELIANEAAAAKAEADRAAIEAEKARAGAEKATTEAENAKSEADRAEAEAEKAKTEADKASAESGKSEAARLAAEAAQGKAADAQQAAELAKNRAAMSQAEAETSRDEAETSQLAAEAAATKAQEAKAAAETARDNAATAATASQAARDASVSAKDGAVSAKNDAVTAKTAAEKAYADTVTAKSDAITAKDQAIVAKVEAESARDGAVEAKTAVEGTAEDVAEGLERITKLENLCKELTIPVSDTAQIAQIDGVIGDLPLDITARAIAIQEGEGDPSPDNKRAIVGVDKIRLNRCGKNLLDISYGVVNGVYNVDGTVRSDMTDKYYVRKPTEIYNALFMQNRGKTFTFSCCPAVAGRRCSVVIFGTRTSGGSYQEVNGTNNANYVSFTIAGDFTSISSVEFRWNRQNSIFTDTTTVFSNFQLEAGSIATQYEPYVGGTFDIALPKTVYGLESAPVKVGVAKGIIENPTRGITFDGTENWYSSKNYDGNNRMVLALSSGSEAKYVASNTAGNMKSSHYLVVSADKTWSGVQGISIQDGKDIIIYDSSFNTVAAWKAHLAAQKAAGTPIQGVYELAEPEIITIDPATIPANDGTNIAYANAGGETTVTGRQSPVAAIEEVKKAIVALGGAINV